MRKELAERSRAAALIAALDRFLEGRSGVTETCRVIVRHHNSHVREQFDLFRPFIAVASETDVFPLGEPRQFWSAEALRREDQKRKKVEAFYVEMLRAAVPPLRTYAFRHPERIR
jgi:hypothetical protein